MVQLACMEISSIQQVYRQVEGRSNRDFERCSCPQAVPVQLISSLVKMAHFHEKGRGMDLLVGHIQERKGPIGQGSKIDYRKISLKNRTGSLEIKPYMYGRVLST